MCDICDGIAPHAVCAGSPHLCGFATGVTVARLLSKVFSYADLPNTAVATVVGMSKPNMNSTYSFVIETDGPIWSLVGMENPPLVQISGVL